MSRPLLALLTQHRKEQALAPVAERLGWDFTCVTHVDTDQLGSFTGERPRDGTAEEVALRKARRACEETGARYGLGSEGSFGPDPWTGLMPWGQETLVWWDAASGQHVSICHQGAQPCYGQHSASDWLLAAQWARQQQFPEVGLVVGRFHEPWFRKGVQDWATLEEACRQSLQAQGEVWLETDMRAHMHPLRMTRIRQAGELLAQRLLSACPACQAPGYGVARVEPGACCEACLTPTARPLARWWHCGRCDHGHREPVAQLADPQHCPRCNP